MNNINTQKTLFVIGKESEISNRFSKYSIYALINSENLNLVFLDNDINVNEYVKNICSTSGPIAVLIHANSNDSDAKEGFKNRFILYKNKLSTHGIHIFIISALTSIKSEYGSEKYIHYDDLMERIQDNSIWVKSIASTSLLQEYRLPLENCYDYLFITALYKAEFEYLKLFCDFKEENSIKERENTHHIGTLKFDTTKKVVAIHQLKTGMVDAAILTAEMIARYKPKTVVMTGVCGGNPNKNDLSIGDIIIPISIFMFEKGKKVIKDGKTILLNELDVVNIQGGLLTQILNKEEEILKKMKAHFAILNQLPKGFNPVNLKIHTDKSMACSTAVIDAKGYFEQVIISKDRNSIGVEMESYAVARACQLSEQKPNCLIIKSVMDKTRFKTDEGKRLAGQTSAKMLEEIIRAGII